LTGAIPGSLTLLTNAVLFRLDKNTDLCRLDAVSTLASDKCNPEACPYPTCDCTHTVCPSGSTNTYTISVNPATSFYPADNNACCPVGDTLRERLVTKGFLDCSLGRPCIATPLNGTVATTL
jgi:hypothetical protein